MYDPTGFLNWASSVSFSDGNIATDNAATATMSITLVSQPRNYNRNTKLGIKGRETYWKCYVANPEAPNPDKPFDEKFSLEDSTSDKPRKIDARWLDVNAHSLFTTLIGVLAFLSFNL